MSSSGDNQLGSNVTMRNMRIMDPSPLLQDSSVFLRFYAGVPPMGSGRAVQQQRRAMRTAQTRTIQGRLQWPGPIKLDSSWPKVFVVVAYEEHRFQPGEGTEIAIATLNADDWPEKGSGTVAGTLSICGGRDVGGGGKAGMISMVLAGMPNRRPSAKALTPAATAAAAAAAASPGADAASAPAAAPTPSFPLPSREELERQERERQARELAEKQQQEETERQRQQEREAEEQERQQQEQLQRLAEERQRLEEQQRLEEKRLRQQAEAEQRRKAEEAERRQQEAEEEKRRRAEAEEELRQKAEEEERRRQQEAEEEQRRKAEAEEELRRKAEEEERRRQQEAEEEQRRKAEEEEELRRKAEEEERRRQQEAEEEQRRKAEEEEELRRKAEEEERERQEEAEAEQRRKAEEAERQRKEDEDQREREERERQATADEERQKLEEQQQQQDDEEEEDEDSDQDVLPEESTEEESERRVGQMARLQELRRASQRGGLGMGMQDDEESEDDDEDSAEEDSDSEDSSSEEEDNDVPPHVDPENQASSNASVGGRSLARVDSTELDARSVSSAADAEALGRRATRRKSDFFELAKKLDDAKTMLRSQSSIGGHDVDTLRTEIEKRTQQKRNLLLRAKRTAKMRKVLKMIALKSASVGFVVWLQFVREAQDAETEDKEQAEANAAAAAAAAAATAVQQDEGPAEQPSVERASSVDSEAFVELQRTQEELDRVRAAQEAERARGATAASMFMGHILTAWYRKVSFERKVRAWTQWRRFFDVERLARIEGESHAARSGTLLTGVAAIIKRSSRAHAFSRWKQVVDTNARQQAVLTRFVASMQRFSRHRFTRCWHQWKDFTLADRFTRQLRHDSLVRAHTAIRRALAGTMGLAFRHWHLMTATAAEHARTAAESPHSVTPTVTMVVDCDGTRVPLPLLPTNTVADLRNTLATYTSKRDYWLVCPGRGLMDEHQELRFYGAEAGQTMAVQMKVKVRTPASHSSNLSVTSGRELREMDTSTLDDIDVDMHDSLNGDEDADEHNALGLGAGPTSGPVSGQPGTPAVNISGISNSSSRRTVDDNALSRENNVGDSVDVSKDRQPPRLVEERASRSNDDDSDDMVNDDINASPAVAPTDGAESPFPSSSSTTSARRASASHLALRELREKQQQQEPQQKPQPEQHLQSPPVVRQNTRGPVMAPGTLATSGQIRGVGSPRKLNDASAAVDPRKLLKELEAGARATSFGAEDEEALFQRPAKWRDVSALLGGSNDVQPQTAADMQRAERRRARELRRAKWHEDERARLAELQEKQSTLRIESWDMLKFCATLQKVSKKERHVAFESWYEATLQDEMQDIHGQLLLLELEQAMDEARTTGRPLDEMLEATGLRTGYAEWRATQKAQFPELSQRIDDAMQVDSRPQRSQRGALASDNRRRQDFSSGTESESDSGSESEEDDNASGGDSAAGALRAKWASARMQSHHMY